MSEINYSYSVSFQAKEGEDGQAYGECHTAMGAAALIQGVMDEYGNVHIYLGINDDTYELDNVTTPHDESPVWKLSINEDNAVTRQVAERIKEMLTTPKAY